MSNILMSDITETDVLKIAINQILMRTLRQSGCFNSSVTFAYIFQCNFITQKFQRSTEVPIIINERFMF